jgi:hypothetical protein
MHTRRTGRLSGTAARRLLDGGDGPPPLPQLLAAATAPATPAELRGESTARAAFRTSVHTAPLPHDIPRRSPVQATSTIMIAKAIAAIALTASTAGGIALATTSTPVGSHPRTTSESAAITGEVVPSSLPLTTPGPTDAARADAEEEAEDTPAAEPDEQRTGTGTGVRTTPAAKAPHPTGLCRAASNVTTGGHPGTAAQSPAFADLRCDAADADTDAEATRPTGRPTGAPANPDRRTGRPDTAGRPEDGTDTETKPEKAAKLDKPADDHAGQARPDDGDAEESSQNRQNG